jgi:hypothetical protein
MAFKKCEAIQDQKRIGQVDNLNFADRLGLSACDTLGEAASG